MVAEQGICFFQGVQQVQTTMVVQRPSAVTCTWRVVRTNNLTPSRCSRRLSTLLTVARGSCNRSAARLKLPSSTIRVKMRIA
ncbi:Uncharacterised protein [Serratia fonticola]|uniref:Uncharacterized protein n=1 Tax=Serratia fonticola TaxID=47917 RepID=A0A3S4XWB6_SERFO|nr:Uncharacterised protein [Serratia fonticola]